DPLLRRLMRRVAKARRVIDEEGFVRCERVLLVNPCDGVVGQICVQVILGIVRWWFDGMGAVEDGRMRLIGIAANEAIEMREAQTGWPEVKRPGLTGLPV